VLEDYFTKLNTVVSQVPPVLLLLLVVGFGMYKFWKECNVTRKWNTSVFDMFFVSLFFGLLGGRASYIISNWQEFNQYIWYWLPYEKYGDQVFFFRLLPWRFFRIWDWEIQIIVMFVSFVIIGILWVLFVKKWKWSHMYTPIFTTAVIMISLSFVLIGMFVNNLEWFFQGIITLLPLLLLTYLQKNIRKRIIGRKEVRILAVTEIIFLSISVLYFSFSYITAEITKLESISLFVFLGIFIISSIAYIIEVNKANVTIETLSSLDTISGYEIGKDIRFSK